MTSRDQAFALCGGAIITAFFLYFAWPGLSYYFDTDDVMNLRRAWPVSMGRLLFDCLPFTPSYRPFGLLVYRLVYDAVGLEPRPFHVVCFALLLLNSYLLFRLARVLTGSLFAGLLAALLGAFHSRADSLYINIGNLYDILCGTLFLTALLLAVSVSEKRDWRLPVLFVVFGLALDTKEMAITLPVLVAAFDWIYARRIRWVLVGLLALEGVAFIAPRLRGSLNEAYQPHYTFEQFRQTWEAYTGQLFYRMHPLPFAAVLGLLLAMGVAALVLRSKPLLFCWIFVILTPLPVAFIELRGLNVWYIPLMGWSIYAAVLLEILIQHIPYPAVPRAAAAFGLTALALGYVHVEDREYRFAPDSGRSEQVRTFRDQFVALCPHPAEGQRVLFLNDSFAPDEWTPSSSLQLYFRRPEMEIQRSKMPEHKEIIANSKYDWIFDYRDGRLVLAPAMPQGSPPGAH